MHTEKVLHKPEPIFLGNNQEARDVINKGYNIDRKFGRVEKDSMSGFFDETVRVFNIKLLKPQIIRFLRV